MSSNEIDSERMIESTVTRSVAAGNDPKLGIPHCMRVQLPIGSRSPWPCGRAVQRRFQQSPASQELEPNGPVLHHDFVPPPHPFGVTFGPLPLDEFVEDDLRLFRRNRRIRLGTGGHLATSATVGEVEDIPTIHAFNHSPTDFVGLAVHDVSGDYSETKSDRKRSRTRSSKRWTPKPG